MGPGARAHAPCSSHFGSRDVVVGTTSAEEIPCTVADRVMPGATCAYHSLEAGVQRRLLERGTRSARAAGLLVAAFVLVAITCESFGALPCSVRSGGCPKRAQLQSGAASAQLLQQVGTSGSVTLSDALLQEEARCPCDLDCTLGNKTASCRRRIAWLVKNTLSAEPQACLVAHDKVLRECLACRGCGKEEVCTSPQEVLEAAPPLEDCTPPGLHDMAEEDATLFAQTKPPEVASANATFPSTSTASPPDLSTTGPSSTTVVEGESLGKQGDPGTSNVSDVNNATYSAENNSDANNSDANIGTLTKHSSCHTATKGERCHTSVTWVLRNGILKHPDWYKGVSAASSFEDVQEALRTDKVAKCPKPCRSCQTARRGDECYEKVSWVMREGIGQHPDWYEGLSDSSRFEEIQDHLHQTDASSSCPKPCAPYIWGSPSLFCFSVMRSSGYEPGLVRSQLQHHASIFACDEFAVFCEQAGLLVGEGPHGNITTTGIDTVQDGTGDWGSWLNTLTFQHAWDALLHDARFKAHDWVVKVDPDAVFLPDRLRVRLGPHTNPGAASYIENCDQPFHIAMQGSLEVFSTGSILAYGRDGWKCKNELEWQNWGEDLYMQKCMEHMGMSAVPQFDIMSDKDCAQFACSDASKVSYHAYKDEAAYWDCWKQTQGQ